MAKKRHHKGKKRRVHHRHRMGAVNTSSITNTLVGALAIVGGLAGGKLLSNAIGTKAPAMVVGGGEVVVGGGIAIKAKPIWLKMLGLGFAAGGAWTLLGNQGLKVLPAAIGYGPDTAVPYRNVPKVGFPQPGNIGFPKPPTVGRMPIATRFAGVYGG